MVIENILTIFFFVGFSLGVKKLLRKKKEK